MAGRRAGSYSTLEVARMLKVTVQTVQRWVDAGHLLAWRTVGGHRRIDGESLQRFREATGELGLSSPESTPTPPLLSAPAPSEPAVETIRVLVVDDDPGDRELLGYLLGWLRPDWQIDYADNGFAALLSIGRTPPHLLITDMVMPHLDGPAMLRSLRDNDELAGMRILAVSSHSADEVATRGGLPEGVPFLGKPLDRTGLLRFLDQTALPHREVSP